MIESCECEVDLLGLRFGRKRNRHRERFPLLDAARSGDGDALNQLIHDYTPFVLKVASHAAGRFLRPGVDEEISVGLMAFNEAVTAYDENKGAFLSFAQTVIRRRLVDYFRRERSRPQEIALTEFEEVDETTGYSSLDQVARSTWDLAQEEQDRRNEIEEFGTILAQYGMSFADLVKVAPKHQDARKRAIAIGHMVADRPEYRAHLIERHELLLKHLVKEPGVSRKTIERHRKYIIAVALILIHDLPHLQAYL